MGRLNTGTLGNPPPGLNVPQYQRSEVTVGIAHFAWEASTAHIRPSTSTT